MIIHSLDIQYKGFTIDCTLDSYTDTQILKNILENILVARYQRIDNFDFLHDLESGAYSIQYDSLSFCFTHEHQKSLL